jgi:hypothetical protein
MSDVPADAKAIFLSALEQTSRKQLDSHLKEACADNPALRARVQKLLRAHQQAGKFLGGPGSIEDAAIPTRLGRYRVDRIVGQGGFGVVFLAQDEQLDRPVAIKVPHAELISRPQDIEEYVAEVRTVASLEHPNIVPVYDVGSSDDCALFIVSKYVRGASLSVRLTESRLTFTEAAELIATVAEALHYAHQHGVVHRDVKPGNILIGIDHTPYVVDFGVALREQHVGKVPTNAGTPAYMSPEQARGEGHRVDSRSDIFSLGSVFFELLTVPRQVNWDEDWGVIVGNPRNSGKTSMMRTVSLIWWRKRS